MMSEAGLQLGEATVSADLPQQNDNPDRQARQAASRAGQGGQAEHLLAGEFAHAPRAGLGLVDTYA